MYAVAIQSGLRSSECRSLTRGRLFLDDQQPYIVCKARSTKNKKDARQYIQPGLGGRTRPAHRDQGPGRRCSQCPTKRTCRMFRGKDLADARPRPGGGPSMPTNACGESRATPTAGQPEGEKADFIACGTPRGLGWPWPVRSFQEVVPTVMRHSTITLTMDTYGHLFPDRTRRRWPACPTSWHRAATAGSPAATRWARRQPAQQIASSTAAKQGELRTRQGWPERRLSTEHVDVQRFKRQTTGTCETWRK